jgi:hypothetical protein
MHFGIYLHLEPGKCYYRTEESCENLEGGVKMYVNCAEKWGWLAVGICVWWKGTSFLQGPFLNFEDKRHRLIWRILFCVAIAMGYIATANAGNLAIQNYTPLSGDIKGETVVIEDNSSDSSYFPLFAQVKFILYTKNFQGENLSFRGINPLNTSVIRLYLETKNIAEGTPNQLKATFPINTGYEGRNMTLRQDPNDTNADPNVYDLWDLTNGGTIAGYINLPNVHNPLNGVVYAQWIVRSDNYADLNFDGKVDFHDFAVFALYWKTSGHSASDNWGFFADVNRDGAVDGKDLGLLTSEWLYSTNDPNTW